MDPPATVYVVLCSGVCDITMVGHVPRLLAMFWIDFLKIQLREQTAVLSAPICDNEANGERAVSACFACKLSKHKFYTANGTLSPKQLSKNITAAFRLAARVYLCSLVPGFHPTQPSCIGLVDKLTAVLQTIPCGPAGFDRSVVWVYLMVGGVSLPTSPFRAFFNERIEQMGELAHVGSFGRVVSLLHEVWNQQDLMQQQQQQPSSPESAASSMGDNQQVYAHWRDVMQMKGWDFLLI